MQWFVINGDAGMSTWQKLGE